MIQFLHVLIQFGGLNASQLHQLWHEFEDWKYVWEHAEFSDLVKAGMQKSKAEQFIQLRKTINTENEFAKLWQQDVHLIDYQNHEYPELLKQIEDPPFAFYRKGAPLTNAHHVAIVGTRKPTTYGENMAYELAEAITKEAIIVSGLAFGIDAMSHLAAVTQNRPTIAVLGSGLNNLTPAAHANAAEKILATGGTLISEYSPNEPAFKGRFLARNRIIAGLANQVIVIEAGQKSGALCTASHAIKTSRPLFALVGDITRPQSQGCLQLIQQGAKPILGKQQLLNALGLHQTADPTSHLNLTPIEQKLLKIIQQESQNIETICEKSTLPFHEVLVHLTKLELKNLIRRNNALLWEVRKMNKPINQQSK